MDSTQKRLQKIGARLRETRESRDLTQSQVAKLAKVGRADISRMETGDANPTLDKLFRVMEALHIKELTV